MKVTIDKAVISMAEAEQAKELRAEYRGYDANLYEMLIRNAVDANRAKISEYDYTTISKVIEIEKVEITKNRYCLTAWISALVRCDLDTLVEISFDAGQAMQFIEGNAVDACVYVYTRKGK